MVAFLIGVAVLGPVLLPFSFTDIPKPDQIVGAGRPPSLQHPMGETGGLQRDVLTLVVNGSRTSLLIGFSSMAIGVVIGTFVGAIAGFAGSITDNLLMRVVDVMLSLPILFVILVAAKFLGNGTVSMVIVIFGLFSWMGVSRLVRSQFLSIREREFVEAAHAVGVRDRRIIFRHILPNAFSPIVVVASLLVAGNIIAEAFVSFLGFGVDPQSPTWGNILSGGLQFITQGNWWWPLFPGLAIIVTVLAVNFVGDGLRDAFDPQIPRMTEASTLRPGLGAPPADNLLLDVRNLQTHFKVMDGVVPAVDGISFSLPRGADARHRGRVRVGQERDGHDDHAPARHPAGPDRRGQRGVVRRPRGPVAARWGDAEDPRQRDGDDLPGAADQPEPGVHGRRPDRRAGQAPQEGQPEGGPRPRRRDAPAGWHPHAGASRQAVPPRALGWHAPARDDRRWRSRASRSCSSPTSPRPRST